jgi:hypothetical protein
MENFWEMCFFGGPFWDCDESQVENGWRSLQKCLTEKKKSAESRVSVLDKNFGEGRIH